MWYQFSTGVAGVQHNNPWPIYCWTGQLLTSTRAFSHMFLHFRPYIEPIYLRIKYKLHNWLTSNQHFKLICCFQCVSQSRSSLTHWDRYQMTAISQTTHSNLFSVMKMLQFRLKFQWNLFLRFNQQYSSIGLDNGLAPTRRPAIIWTNCGYCQRIYASLGLSELNAMDPILWDPLRLLKTGIIFEKISHEFKKIYYVSPGIRTSQWGRDTLTCLCILCCLSRPQF